jgi:hypothetical protein
VGLMGQSQPSLALMGRPRVKNGRTGHSKAAYREPLSCLPAAYVRPVTACSLHLPPGETAKLAIGRVLRTPWTVRSWRAPGLADEAPRRERSLRPVVGGSVRVCDSEWPTRSSR